jgi:hypothetical protein
MSTLIGLLVLGGIIVGGYILYNKNKESDERRQLETDADDDVDKLGGGLGGRSLDKLQIDDIASYLGTDYMVEGRVDYNEDGYQWVEYMLADGDDIRWLCIEQDDRIEVTIWQETTAIRVDSPPNEFIEHDGTKYRMVERGEAKAIQEGETGRKNKSRVDYYDYEGPDGKYLGIESWGGDTDVFLGRDIEPDMVDVFPGDQIG